MLSLSVLDQSTIAAGRPPSAAIAESLALARHADRLGYARYWVSEHHNSDSIAGTAPEVLMGAIAATTTRIRVGSAGVMLPHYSALKVAEQFRVLEALAPGRIDLGVGRAPGSDRHTAFALNPNADRAAELFPAQIRDLLAWTSGAPLVENHPFRTVRAQPAGPGAPQVWVLGSSEYGAQVAAFFGLPFCYAHFITDGRGAEAAMAMYHDQFRPGANLAAPHAAMCVWALACESEEEADRQFATRALWRLGRDQGVYEPLPSPDDALARSYSLAEQAHIDRLRAISVYGTPDRVADRLRALANAAGVDEVAVLTATHAATPRLRSYELLADQFGLTAALHEGGNADTRRLAAVA